MRFRLLSSVSAEIPFPPGVNRMDPKNHQSFIKKHEAGTLVKPEDCGAVIAALAIRATPDLSGQFVSWDEEKLASYRE